MARGEDTRHHPGRKVDPWSWKGNRGQNTDTERFGPQDLSVNPDSGGYTATLDQTYRSGKRYGATEDPYEQYEAGPFRTPQRAKIAGMSLGNRVQEGSGARYRIKGM
jgi:hypothetical protein